MIKILMRAILFITCFIACNVSADELMIVKDPDATNNKFETHVLLDAKHQATLTTQLSTKITKIPLEPGDSFKKGDLLIQFDCDEESADLEKAQAQLNTTQVAYHSSIELYKLNIISKLEEVQAKDEYKKAQADLDRIKIIIKDCTIKAPFPGEIVDIYVHEDEISNPSHPLMSIVDNKDLILKLFVPSDWLSWLKIKTPFQVKFDETENSYSATITRIDPEIDAASQTVAAFGKLDHPDEKLIAGMSGMARFKEQTHPQESNISMPSSSTTVALPSTISTTLTPQETQDVNGPKPSK